FHAASSTVTAPVTPPAATSDSGPWAKPDGSSHAVATMPTSVSRATATDRRGRRATTGVNWCAAPRTAVVRNASIPTWTAATAPGWAGAVTMRSAANQTASPKSERPRPAAARKLSGTDGGGTDAPRPGTNGAAGAVRGAGSVWTTTCLSLFLLVNARRITPGSRPGQRQEDDDADPGRATHAAPRPARDDLRAPRRPRHGRDAPAGERPRPRPPPLPARGDPARPAPLGVRREGAGGGGRRQDEEGPGRRRPADPCGRGRAVRRDHGGGRPGRRGRGARRVRPVRAGAARGRAG